MNLTRTFLIPAVLLAGLVVSTFVIVTALQAAPSGIVPVETVQLASNTSPEDLASEGRALFIAKGCLVCHEYQKLAQERGELNDFDFGSPNLTSVKIDRDYLRRWLADPHAVKPATNMPNLQLSASEIEALVAFLTQPAP